MHIMHTGIGELRMVYLKNESNQEYGESKRDSCGCLADERSNKVCEANHCKLEGEQREEHVAEGVLDEEVDLASCAKGDGNHDNHEREEDLPCDP